MTPSGPSTFRKNRESGFEGDVAHACFTRVLAQTRERGLLSDEPFTVDGTRIEAWARQKSCMRKAAEPPAPPDDPDNPQYRLPGERRPNATHVWTTDPAARPDNKAKGPEAKPAYLGHVCMENRHGRVVNTRVTQVSGTAEREAALAMAEVMPGQQLVTLGADKHDETCDFVRVRRALRVTPPVA
jgi:hypothetical protein